MLPAEAPVAPDIDFRGLAHRFEMTGGYIRNAALRAAFLAADAGTAITDAQLEHAARLEYEGMGKIVAPRAQGRRGPDLSAASGMRQLAHVPCETSQLYPVKSAR